MNNIASKNKIDSEFKLDDKKKKQIAQALGLDIEEVIKIDKRYDEIRVCMKKHYLAHLIRALEDKLKSITKNDLFQISVMHFPENDKSATVSCADYIPGCCFSIYYPKEMDQKQLRISLAHELGHLFLVECVNSHFKEKKCDEHSNMEPISTLFGILAVMDKNDYHRQKTYECLVHKTWDDILKDFKLLGNRDKGIYNKS